MRYFILPYRQGSASARALAHALGGRVLRLIGSTYKRQAGDVIVNWGATTDGPVIGMCTIYNPIEKIKRASNKLKFFQLMREKGLDNIIPEFWTDASAIPDEAFPVVCRTVLAGHSGDGIVIAATRSDLVSAPLYVRYIKKQFEFRVHVGMVNRLYHFSGDHTNEPESNEYRREPTVIAFQRKARRRDVPDGEVDWQIRNHSNGFVYVRQGVNAPSSVRQAAIDALGASGLDFGGCDVIYNTAEKRAYVLEINTACGLEGQTVDDYANYFRSLA